MRSVASTEEPPPNRLARWLAAFGAMTLTISCVVTDVEEATGGGDVSGTGGSGGYDTSTGAFGGESAGGSSNGGSGGNGGPIVSDGIDCGAATCSGGDVCCVVNGMGSCMTEQACIDVQIMTVPAESIAIMKCDDLLDCGGNACCVTGSEMVQVYECSFGTACQRFESCSTELECSTPGEVCVPTTGGSNFKCVHDGSSVECGATCSGSTPVCCDDASPSCAPFGGGCGNPFECDGGSDCGGKLCCATTSGSSCLGECYDPAPVILCDAIGDCPSTPVAPIGCVLDPNLGPAPGYQVCVYP